MISRAWLQLLRLPNLFTVPGDPIVGFLLACGAAHQGVASLDYRVAFAVVASLCLYSAGLIMNDLFDLVEDRRDRPKRPLPSGQIAPQQAWIAAIVLSLIGLGSMYLVSSLSGLKIAAVLLACIALYNGATKHIPVIGAVNMGLCRGLSLILGAVAFTGRVWPHEGIVVTGAVLIAAYIAAVTNLARHETRSSSPMTARFMPAVVLLLAFLFFHIGRLPFLVAPSTTALAVALTLTAVETGRLGQKDPPPLPPVIGGLIRILLVIQAALSLVFPSTHGWITAGVLVLAAPVAKYFGRRFYAS
jgi:4-hydroxybenzoate polyprenyltransferase